MMECLEAGGLEVVKSNERDRFNKSHSDEHYQPNQSLYELLPKEITSMGFPRQYDGKAIKVVALWTPYLAVHKYRVVFMKRNYEEIRQSYEAAFNKIVSTDLIEQRTTDSIERFKNRKDVESFQIFNYRDVLSSPKKYFDILFNTGWPIDSNKAALKVLPKIRFKIENLTVGI